jgi:hypothetical protein
MSDRSLRRRVRGVDHCETSAILRAFLCRLDRIQRERRFLVVYSLQT